MGIVALAFFAMQRGLGLRRLWFGALDAANRRIEARQTLLLDPGILPGELSFELGSRHLFAKLMERTQAICFNAANREKLAVLLPEGLRPRLGEGEFFAMSLHHKNAPRALFFADQAGKGPALDERRYASFKQICLAAGQALERMPG
jgi:hypothetical protein